MDWLTHPAILGAVGGGLGVLALGLLLPRRNCPTCGEPLPKFRRPSKHAAAAVGRVHLPAVRGRGRPPRPVGRDRRRVRPVRPAVRPAAGAVRQCRLAPVRPLFAGVSAGGANGDRGRRRAGGRVPARGVCGVPVYGRRGGPGGGGVSGGGVGGDRGRGLRGRPKSLQEAEDLRGPINFVPRVAGDLLDPAALGQLFHVPGRRRPGEPGDLRGTFIGHHGLTK